MEYYGETCIGDIDKVEYVQKCKRTRVSHTLNRKVKVQFHSNGFTKSKYNHSTECG